MVNNLSSPYIYLLPLHIKDVFDLLNKKPPVAQSRHYTVFSILFCIAVYVQLYFTKRRLLRTGLHKPLRGSK